MNQISKREYLGQTIKQFKDKILITVYYKEINGIVKTNDFYIYIKEN